MTLWHASPILLELNPKMLHWLLCQNQLESSWTESSLRISTSSTFSNLFANGSSLKWKIPQIEALKWHLNLFISSLLSSSFYFWCLCSWQFFEFFSRKGIFSFSQEWRMASWKAQQLVSFKGPIKPFINFYAALLQWSTIFLRLFLSRSEVVLSICYQKGLKWT